MNVLVLGNGGRECALAWKIAQSPSLGKLFVMNGNPGTAPFAENVSGDVKDFDQVRDIIGKYAVDLLVVGPEDPLVNGITDYMAAEIPELKVVGPGRAGAMLEGSKQFAKRFMKRYGIPTADFKSFDGAGQLPEAMEYLDTLAPPYVLKADGLAAGKGVIIAPTKTEAEKGLEEMFGGKFGKAGHRVVIEQFLSGIEVSVFILTDGRNWMLLPEAKDYKRIGEGDTGLNTGGMGSVSPVPFCNSAFMDKVRERIIQPTIDGLVTDKIPYRGFVFFGLINCGGDPYVIEYNCRMGDPETQSVMPRIKSDFLGHLYAAASGNLKKERIEVSGDTAVSIVAVSGGYPESYGKGYRINGMENAESVTIFQSGTRFAETGTGGKDTASKKAIVTSGGRVLAVTAIADDIAKAREKGYRELAKIDFDKMYCRHDIGCDLMKR
ncbi:MAG: phosphoribosylamine--glycine ligase [Bacteroidales bacterium]|nr:phosphoribosylamine--glycine ligase [Bacteroidales bacterium]MCI2122127.1 phosphoribosylamine--glycine ligase [Bacteroidales bacterium]MCI2145638.1 phosphoribosylamine--glycine ligase [Bacteroidales bacterium]